MSIGGPHEVLPSHGGPSCAAFLERARAHFGHHGVGVRRGLTDNVRS